MLVLSFALLLASLANGAQAAWLYTKATLAQHLIENAWQHSLTDNQPAKPWPWADTWPVAELYIPALDYRAWVLQGAGGASLAFGPGLAAGSVTPGDTGTSVIGGHRDTHFEALQYLKPNQAIDITNHRGETHRFRVTDLRVVDTQTSAINASSDTATVVLVTCYPFNALRAGGTLRYVVEARKT